MGVVATQYKQKNKMSFAEMSRQDILSLVTIDYECSNMNELARDEFYYY